MKKKIITLILTGIISISVIACGDSDSEQNSAQEDTSENVIWDSDDESPKTDSITDFGITVETFVNAFTKKLAMDDIAPTNSNDMDTFYYLYFEGENENDSLLMTMEKNRRIKSMTLDTSIKNFDIVCKRCIETINMDIDAEKLMDDLETTPVIVDHDFSFCLSSNQLTILSYGGEVTLVEDSTSTTSKEETKAENESAMDSERADIATDDDPLGFNVMFSNSYKNDTTGNWRLARIAEDIDIEEYALDYYKNYFKSDDEIHIIVNFTRNTTTRIISFGGAILDVTIMDYVDGEEHDAKLACSGTLLSEYQIDVETGAIDKIQ